MAISSSINHLIKLIDDESEKVKELVTKELQKYPEEIKDVLLNTTIDLSVRQKQKLEFILAENENQIKNPELIETKASGESIRFHIGQIVRHVRYGYRGVIVDFDNSCQADPQWYSSNRTQPYKNQAWYHVLVHNSQQITYAAQTSLADEEIKDHVEHPLIDYFFINFSEGEYIRNDRPWLSEEK